MCCVQFISTHTTREYVLVYVWYDSIVRLFYLIIICYSTFNSFSVLPLSFDTFSSIEFVAFVCICERCLHQNDKQPMHSIIECKCFERNACMHMCGWFFLVLVLFFLFSSFLFWCYGFFYCSCVLKYVCEWESVHHE